MDKRLIIPEFSDAGLRLDVYLSEELETTRSQIDKLVKFGAVTVNGNSVKSGYLVKQGDCVEVDFPESAQDLTPQDIPLDVLYEDDAIAVINKAHGMTVHPGGGCYSGTLANALLYRHPQIGHAAVRGSGLVTAKEDASYLDSQKVSQGEVRAVTKPDHVTAIRAVSKPDPLTAARPGIVHRLDKDTSGVMVVAKTAAAHLKLSEHFAARKVSKTYIALLEGNPKFDAGELKTLIARDPKNRKLMCVSKHEGREAVTRYRVLERFEHNSLVEFNILTGRTHQIRVHAKHLGHPVVGDAQYGYKKQKFNVSGQLLHAKSLTFFHPVTGEERTFEAGLPQEFERVLGILRSKCSSAVVQ
ncbi:MAG: RluA family pseudouridine synthase [Firmicutes bacterium]|nr:RluA family pseudouridine synthase [Bacillota bacterium]